MTVTVTNSSGLLHPVHEISPVQLPQVLHNNQFVSVTRKLNPGITIFLIHDPRIDKLIQGLQSLLQSTDYIHPHQLQNIMWRPT